MAGVSQSVGELGLEAELAGGVQLGAGLPLLLASLPDGRL